MAGFPKVDLKQLQSGLMEYGVMGLSAVGGAAAWRFAEPQVGKLVDMLPLPKVGKVGPTVVAILQAVLGVFAAQLLMKANKQVAIGVGVGLVADSASNLVGLYMPQAAATAGIGGYSVSGLSGSPVEVEEVEGIGMLSGAPVEVEEVEGIGTFAGGF